MFPINVPDKIGGVILSIIFQSIIGLLAKGCFCLKLTITLMN
jgi:hypothetical protein